MPPPTVEVLQVIQKDIPIYSEWIGITDGIVNATIRSQIQGYLIKRNYKEGDYVKKGEILFQIDPRPFEAALKQALAQFSQSRAVFATDSANLRRTQMLSSQHALSQRDLDNATATDRSSRSSVTAAQAAVDMARINLGFTKIISPISGIAGIAQAQVGDLVGPALTGGLTTVSVLNPIQVNYSVSEQEYLRLFIDDSSNSKKTDSMKYELFLTDNSLYPYTGKFYTIDRQVNPGTGTIKLEALFPNPGNVLRPGQFARIRVTTEIKRGALLVPQRAVTELQGKTMVAIVNQKQTIEIRMVTVGQQMGSLWVIQKGLTPGDLVVVEGVQKVKPGVTVVPKPFSSDSISKSQSGKKSADSASEQGS
jgi:membrane fusion protein (multidrug efflux system)